ncbi:thiamine pyrophosphate-dependent enzyme [Bacilliculturomica massiliensis]|uniref:thiamine pyrophosphate-dependent enzyme n=1 Tax=Bacilliculturomica massiliensis TaxID=1917867 RepID=UPI00102FD700|nr:thiamine pyrophosphate-dependent enzyme [Bacilliculturomica massiliensis]
MAVTKTTPTMVSIANSFCPGCGHGILNRLIAEVIQEKGFENKTILTLGVGCSCNMNSSWNGDKIQCAHGRGASTATGVKVARKDLLSIAYQGDGDAYVIGLAETLNAAYRNEPITVFVVNNNNFAMTGGQMSWTTMPGQVTTSSVHGRNTDETGLPIKVPEIVAEFPNVAYVARGSVHSAKEINRLKGYVRDAIEAQLSGEGYSLVEVLCPCPTNWGMSVKQSVDWIEKEVVPYYNLGALKERKGE